LALGATGCTRAKKEATTPPLVVAVATLTLTPTGPTPVTVFTPEAPPTPITPVAGPTTIIAELPSPTAIPFATAVPVTTPVPGEFEYTVQWGDTLYSLAQRFDTTVDAIVALNGLQDASYIRVGQVLRISGTAAPVPAPGTGGEYTVQAGDTLYSIARRYGTTVEAIQSANGIVNPSLIRVGQKLIIPGGGTTPAPTTGGTTYVVQADDTLYSIAARFGKNVWDIVVANNLADPSLIYVGQVLIIP
jgi:peptidoglycan-N-acetylglucosamine deacetylase